MENQPTQELKSESVDKKEVTGGLINSNTQFYDNYMSKMIQTLNDSRFDALDKRLAVLEAKVTMLEKIILK